MTTPDRVLIERWQRYGDADARNALVERYAGLVRALAARYADRGEPFDDLVQVAWIGLLKAIDRFDSSRDVQLTTYATPTSWARSSVTTATARGRCTCRDRCRSCASGCTPRSTG